MVSGCGVTGCDEWVWCDEICVGGFSVSYEGVG